MTKESLFVRGACVLGCLFFLVFSAPAPAAAGGVYFVKAGDTVAGISRLFGVEVDRIIEVNRLKTTSIAPGDRLRIPDPSAAPVPAVDNAVRREVSSDRILQAVCRDEKVYHSVVKGDTLYSISSRYTTEVGHLLQLNGLRKGARLSIGQKILVRRSGPRSHVVRSGETLIRIASRYGVEADEIARLNQMDGARLVAGRQLLIERCDPAAIDGGVPPPLGGPEVSGTVPGGAKALNAEATAAVAERVINIARTMLNVPYRFGGNTLRGIDCSAYVQRVFGQMDVPLPRTAREQYTVGSRIDRDDLQTGDLVFFRTYASFPSHVGIYLGENLFIHASSMVRKVSIDRMDLPYYRKRFIGARRLVEDNAPAVAATP